MILSSNGRVSLEWDMLTFIEAHEVSGWAEKRLVPDTNAKLEPPPVFIIEFKLWNDTIEGSMEQKVKDLMFGTQNSGFLYYESDRLDRPFILKYVLEPAWREVFGEEFHGTVGVGLKPASQFANIWIYDKNAEKFYDPNSAFEQEPYEPLEPGSEENQNRVQLEQALPEALARAFHMRLGQFDFDRTAYELAYGEADEGSRIYKFTTEYTATERLRLTNKAVLGAVNRAFPPPATDSVVDDVLQNAQRVSSSGHGTGGRSKSVRS